MGIHGVFKEIGAGKRISLAKLSADHLITQERPFRVAIDISIWLFQIQAGKGGSNPALRTFFYRVVRLLSLNIHPLFVFDGPNKPLFKRNKRVGGPGVRVATVPEFLAKQLLKNFRLPSHVAPGEAEAECALLQREGIVDAVLSEDVDTLMFGSKLTMRNWTSENSAKSPTHVNVYDDAETERTSGLTREGMVLVALMSGGDYVPEGIPGCGPKVACDAARAGFGRELCALKMTDIEGLRAWKERLQHEIKTNESKFFSRRNKILTIPEDFPNAEVFGYYTHPCVSSSAKIAKLRNELRWDQEIDFDSLRSFTADAFDWRCRGGASKFIKTLAPAMLVRQLWLRSNAHQLLDVETQAEQEQELVRAIYGKRQHCTTDETLEYRISFMPAALVPIDLSIEEEDDAAGPSIEDDSDIEGFAPPTGTQIEGDDAPPSPKKRVFKPYDPTALDKLWMVQSFLQLSCPLLIEDYEATCNLPKQLRPSQKANKAGTRRKARNQDMQENALLQYVKVTKPIIAREREALSEARCRHNSRPAVSDNDRTAVTERKTDFRLPSTHVPTGLFKDKIGDDCTSTSQPPPKPDNEVHDVQKLVLPVVAVASSHPQKHPERPTISKKRSSSDLASPARSPRKILTFFTSFQQDTGTSTSFPETIDLVSSPAASQCSSPRRVHPAPSRTPEARRSTGLDDQLSDIIPDTVTKRRRRSPLKRWNTEPAPCNLGNIPPLEDFVSTNLEYDSPPIADEAPVDNAQQVEIEIIDLASSSPQMSEHDLPSAEIFVQTVTRGEIRKTEEPNAVTSSNINNGQNTSHKASALPTRTLVLPKASASLINNAKKKRIQLRESLAGSWREIEAEGVEKLDLTALHQKAPNRVTGARATNRALVRTVSADVPGRSWRKSEVEILDLTSL